MRKRKKRKVFVEKKKRSSEECEEMREMKRMEKILPQSPRHTMKEAEDSSPMDHTSIRLHYSSASPFLLLLNEFLIPK